MHDSPHHDPHASNGALGYETREVNIKLILLSTAGMVVVVLITCFLTVGIFDFLNSHSAAVDQTTSLERPKEIPPEPRVLEHPWDQLPALHETEFRILNSYGWLDQKTGQVRIPVDRAIDLLAERGLPMAPATALAGAKKPTAAPAAAKEDSGQ